MLLLIASGSQLEGSMFGSAYGGLSQKERKKPNDLMVTCECTLEELYIGCMKTINYERFVLGLDGKSPKKSNDSIEVEIKPGYSKSTVLRYSGRGNEHHCYPTCK